MTPAPISVERLEPASSYDSTMRSVPYMAANEQGGYVRHSDYAALLHQLAERDAECERLQAELDFMTAHYERQTAYAVNHRGALIYASAGMRDAYSEEHVRAEAAERAREEACGLLRDVIAWRRTVPIAETPNRKDGGIFGRIAAFLAASGGGRED